MGIDYYCDICGEAFPDVIDYGYCVGCDSTLCASCKEDAIKNYNKFDEYGEIAECNNCNKPKLNREKFNTLMYALTKEASRTSFVSFLESCGLTDEDYNEIKEYLVSNYNIKPYV